MKKYIKEVRFEITEKESARLQVAMVDLDNVRNNRVAKQLFLDGLIMHEESKLKRKKHSNDFVEEL